MKYIIIFSAIFLFASCSKKDETNPVNNTPTATGFMLCQVNTISWSADELQAYRQSGSLYLTGINNENGASEELLFRIINLSQIGSFGIGENEPGFTYSVKSTYTQKGADGSMHEVFTAYYKDYSLLKINAITDNSIDAEFSIFMYNPSRTDSLIINSGRMKLEY